MSELMIRNLLEKQGLVQEFGWAEEEFLVWVKYTNLLEFMNALGEIVGYKGFVWDDDVFNCQLQPDGVCLNLVPFVDSVNIHLEELFSREKYTH